MLTKIYTNRCTLVFVSILYSQENSVYIYHKHTNITNINVYINKHMHMFIYAAVVNAAVDSSIFV